MRIIKKIKNVLSYYTPWYVNIIFSLLIKKFPFLNLYLMPSRFPLKEGHKEVIKAQCKQQNIKGEYVCKEFTMCEYLLSLIFTEKASILLEEIFDLEKVKQHPGIFKYTNLYNNTIIKELPEETKALFNFYKHLPPHFFPLTQKYKDDLTAFFRFEGIDEKTGLCGCFDKHPHNPFSCGFERRIKIYEPYEMGYAVGTVMEGRTRYKDIMQKEGVVNFDPSVIEMMSYMPLKVREGEETLEGFTLKNKEYKDLFFERYYQEMYLIREHLGLNQNFFSYWFSSNFLKITTETQPSSKSYLQQFHNFIGGVGWLWVGSKIPTFPLLHYYFLSSLEKKDEEMVGYIEDVKKFLTFNFFPRKQFRKVIKKYKMSFFPFKDDYRFIRLKPSADLMLKGKKEKKYYKRIFYNARMATYIFYRE